MLQPQPATRNPKHAVLRWARSAAYRPALLQHAWFAVFMSRARRLRECLLLGAGAELDIKKTSYKKLSKLLSTFEKKVSSE